MIRTIACLLLAATAVLASAERIPADCRWMMHADLRAMFASKVGEWIGREMVKQPHAARLQLLEALTGLNPRRDLISATICGVGADDDTGLVYVRGAFDAARLSTMAQAAEGYAAVQAGSRTIHTWMDKGKPAAGCLATADLLILGKTSTRIREALALLDAPGQTGAILAVPAGWDKAALVVCAAEQLGELAAGKPESAMLRNVRAFAARIHAPDDRLVLEARATATGETAAQQMVDAGRGLIAILQLQRPEKLDPALAEAVRGAQLARDGALVTLSLSLPFDEALRLVEQGRSR